jgi:hypothetical protein
MSFVIGCWMLFSFAEFGLHTLTPVTNDKTIHFNIKQFTYNAINIKLEKDITNHYQTTIYDTQKTCYFNY